MLFCSFVTLAHPVSTRVTADCPRVHRPRQYSSTWPSSAACKVSPRKHKTCLESVAQSTRIRARRMNDQRTIQPFPGRAPCIQLPHLETRVRAGSLYRQLARDAVPPTVYICVCAQRAFCGLFGLFSAAWPKTGRRFLGRRRKRWPLRHGSARAVLRGRGLLRRRWLVRAAQSVQRPPTSL